MGQIKDTLKHEGVSNVAKELLKTIHNGEPKKCLQEQKDIIGPTSFLYQQ